MNIRWASHLSVMKIKVTEMDIQDGIRRDATNCAVARALRRAGIAHSGVAGTLVLLARGTKQEYVVLPGKVQEWIAEFDAGGNARPMEFDLALPEWALQESREIQTECQAIRPAENAPSYRRSSPIPDEVVLEA
jgi:hypothetical protein